MRLFVAVELPEPAIAALAALQTGLQASSSPAMPAVRWSPPRNLHLTLRFLGEVEWARLPEVIAVVRETAARHAPFSMALDRLGGFPDTRAPRVIWVGLAGDVAALRALAATVDVALCAAGFGAADKPFAPHVTLGRIATPAPWVEWAAVLAATRIAAVAVDVTAVRVAESVLAARGARYTTQATVCLSSPI